MKNWIIVLLIFLIPLGVYTTLEIKRGNGAIVSEAKDTIGKPVVYKFTSPMCSECQSVQKILDKIKDDWDLVVFEEINVSGTGADKKRAKQLIAKYDITMVPTLVFIDNTGNVYKKIEVDMTQEDIESALIGIAPKRKK